MNYIQFENLIGKHISVAEPITGNEFHEANFKSENTKIKRYSNSEYLNKQLDYELKDYFGMPYINLFIETDRNDTIQSITAFFHKQINRSFYDSFNEVYGEPDNILVIENRKLLSKKIVTDKKNNIKQELTKSEFDLREGTFEEDPLYIIWEKENYQIKAFLRHKTGISEITFSLPSDKF